MNRITISYKIFYDIHTCNNFLNNTNSKYHTGYYMNDITYIFYEVYTKYREFQESVFYLQKYSCYENKKYIFFIILLTFSLVNLHAQLTQNLQSYFLCFGYLLNSFFLKVLLLNFVFDLVKAKFAEILYLTLMQVFPLSMTLKMISFFFNFLLFNT